MFELVIIAVVLVVSSFIFYRIGLKKGFKSGADFIIQKMETMLK